MITLSKYYQQVPFDEYKHINVSRDDCHDRYRKIKENFGDYEGKRAIDIACSNGYFCFSFLLDGMEFVLGVETNLEEVAFCNDLANEKSLNLFVSNKLPTTNDHFDIGLYLDTHYHSTTLEAGYLEYLYNNCDTVFTSCRNKGSEENKKYEAELKELFDNVDHIYTGFNNRKLFKCE